MHYKINTEFKKYETLESIKDILNDLKKHKDDISSLDLSFNTFVPSVFEEISKSIKKLKNLKKIKLESFFDSLTYEEMSKVLSLLSNSLTRNLVSFEIPSNAVSCNFPEDFGKFLSECPLTILNLYDCGLGQEGLAKISKHLDNLENKGNLEVLNLSKNRINCIEESFASILCKFKNLKEFRIRHNTIEEVSLSYFLKNMKNENLEILDLSDNFVVEECILSLGDLFLRSNLKELLLYDSKMNSNDLQILIQIFNTKAVQELPGGMGSNKSEFSMDISCLDFEQNVVPILEEFCNKFKIVKLVVFENCCDDLSTLKKIIENDGGILVENEEDVVAEGIDEEIISKIKNL